MNMQRHILWAAIVLLVAGTGCTASSNPVGAQDSEDEVALGKRTLPGTSYAIGQVEGTEQGPGGGDVEAVATFSVSSVVGSEQTAEGSFVLKDNTGAWYRAAIWRMQMGEAGEATFSGPITASNPSSTSLVPMWVYVWVRDGDVYGDEPDALVHQVGPPPADGSDDVLPDENGTTFQILGGDIVVSTGALASVAAR